MDGILPYLAVTPHYYLTNHFDSFVSFIVRFPCVIEV